MSAMRIYIMRDRVIRTFVRETLQADHNDESVARNLRDLIQPGNFLHRHPEDFEVWCLGYYDDVGELTAEKRVVGLLSDLLAAKDKPLSIVEA